MTVGECEFNRGEQSRNRQDRRNQQKRKQIEYPAPPRRQSEIPPAFQPVIEIIGRYHKQIDETLNPAEADVIGHGLAAGLLESVFLHQPVEGLRRELVQMRRHVVVGVAFPEPAMLHRGGVRHRYDDAGVGARRPIQLVEDIRDGGRRDVLDRMPEGNDGRLGQVGGQIIPDVEAEHASAESRRFRAHLDAEPAGKAARGMEQEAPAAAADIHQQALRRGNTARQCHLRPHQTIGALQPGCVERIIDDDAGSGFLSQTFVTARGATTVIDTGLKQGPAADEAGSGIGRLGRGFSPAGCFGSSTIDRCRSHVRRV